MPIAPNSDRVEFLESFSIMPEANNIIMSLSIATVFVCISSVAVAYKLYIEKEKFENIE